MRLPCLWFSPGVADTLNGDDKPVVDTNTSEQAYTVVDGTGTGAGWTVTAEATPFTGSATGAVLPDATVFETYGDPSSESDTSVRAVQCANGSGCTLHAAHAQREHRLPRADHRGRQRFGPAGRDL